MLREIEVATHRREAIWAQLCWISDELEDLGAPGATDHDVLFKLMARMLSICEHRGIGHASSQNARAVINHVWTEIKNRESKEDGLVPDPSPTCSARWPFRPLISTKDRRSRQNLTSNSVPGMATSWQR